MGKSARWVFSVICVSAIALSGVYPSWASVAQSQAYGGYVDLALQSLGFPQQVTAGTEVTLPLRISNLGPDSADVPQVVFSSDANFRLVATSGCAGSPQAQSRCLVTAPLAPGENRDLSYSGIVDPAARRVLTFGAFALSEAIDLHASNEMVVAALPIVTSVDLNVQALWPQAQVANDGRVYWDIEVANNGPSDAINVPLAFNATPWNEHVLSCEALGVRTQCPDPSGYARIGSGSALRFRVSFPPLSATTPGIYFSLHAYPDETEVNYSNNGVYLSLEDLMHLDDFEY